MIDRAASELLAIDLERVALEITISLTGAGLLILTWLKFGRRK